MGESKEEVKILDYLSQSMVLFRKKLMALVRLSESPL